MRAKDDFDFPFQLWRELLILMGCLDVFSAAFTRANKG